MPYMDCRGKKIYYEIIRSKRKTIGIKISYGKGVEVRTPRGAKKNEVEGVLKKKADWIANKLEDLEEIKPPPLPKEFVTGEKLLYLGQEYPLRVIRNHELDKEIFNHNQSYRKKKHKKVPQNKIEIKFENNMFLIFSNLNNLDNENDEIDLIREKLELWYREKAKEIIKERVDIYSNELKIYPKNIKIKTQKKRWGSCSSRGNLNFNWKLVMTPLEVIDYVVVHELVHLKHPDHSPEFWQEIERIVPDYKKCQEWLRINGLRLSF